MPYLLKTHSQQRSALLISNGSTKNRYTENKESALTLLYQGGYLTIEDYDKITDSYILTIPNSEVYTDLLFGQIPLVVGIDPGRVQIDFAARFWKALKRNDLELAINEMKAFLAGIPYVEGVKEKLKEAAVW